MDTLEDLGERRIITEILAQRYSGDNTFGDDCSVIDFGQSHALVVTTDPCPVPMAWMLGYKSYYYYGWLLTTINLSDIASMGAKPLGLLTSLILPSTTKVSDFEDLLQGIDDAASEFSTKVLGGNLKESKEVSISATAVGLVDKNNLMLREGAKLNDKVVVIGDLGLFWSGVFANLKKINLDEEVRSKALRNILKPKAKINEGQIIAKKNYLSCCIDNSDGLYPSLKQIIANTSLDMMLDFSRIGWDDVVMEISSKLGLDPVRLALGWGDWQLIGTMPEHEVQKLKMDLVETGTPIHIIGDVVAGSGNVQISLGEKTGELLPLDSERFSKQSWFSAGIESYYNMMLTAPLIVE